MAWTRTSAVACSTSQFLKVSKRPVSLSVLKMTTPQKVIQSTAQIPVALPMKYAWIPLLIGMPHTATARIRVRTEPISVASQAVTRKTASITSSAITGMSATRTVRPRFPSGLST